MTKTTSFFKKHITTSGDVTNTYAVLWFNVIISSKIRLLAMSAYNVTNSSHIELFVQPSGADKVFIKDEAVGADYSVTWTGSLILDSMQSFGAVFWNPILSDELFLRVIWEDLA